MLLDMEVDSVHDFSDYINLVSSCADSVVIPEAIILYPGYLCWVKAKGGHTELRLMDIMPLQNVLWKQDH